MRVGPIDRRCKTPTTVDITSQSQTAVTDETPFGCPSADDRCCLVMTNASAQKRRELASSSLARAHSVVSVATQRIRPAYEGSDNAHGRLSADQFSDGVAFVMPGPEVIDEAPTLGLASTAKALRAQTDEA